jgi:hypothetical protein
MKRSFFRLAFCLLSGLSVAAEVRNVTVRQLWPWSRKVEIYPISGS